MPNDFVSPEPTDCKKFKHVNGIAGPSHLKSVSSPFQAARYKLVVQACNWVDHLVVQGLPRRRACVQRAALRHAFRDGIGEFKK